MRVDGGAHRLVVALHHAARRLRIEPLVQRRRADEVGEDDRDDLARAGVGRLARRGVDGGRGARGPQRAPHSPQNFSPASYGAPQPAQASASARAALGAELPPGAVLVAAGGAGHGALRCAHSSGEAEEDHQRAVETQQVVVRQPADACPEFGLTTPRQREQDLYAGTKTNVDRVGGS